MSFALELLIGMLIGSLLVINFFLGQLIVTLTTHFSEKTRQLRREQYSDPQDPKH